MMRGRIVALKRRAGSQDPSAGDAAWVLDGDRASPTPTRCPRARRSRTGAGGTPVEGAGHLVSFEGDLARMLGLKLGDTVTVNVLGGT